MKNWRKICGIKRGQNCFNCANRIKIKETKHEIVVTCELNGVVREINFDRRIRPEPYCGGYAGGQQILNQAHMNERMLYYLTNHLQYDIIHNEGGDGSI